MAKMLSIDEAAAFLRQLATDRGLRFRQSVTVLLSENRRAEFPGVESDAEHRRGNRAKWGKIPFHRRLNKAYYFPSELQRWFEESALPVLTFERDQDEGAAA